MADIAGADIKIEWMLDGVTWVDITCDATSADWHWGAVEGLGPLTESEGGTLRVSLWDPERTYDPDNPDVDPLLRIGIPMRVTVDGAPCWTGSLQTWGWDRVSRIADLNAFDPIGMLSMRILPDGEEISPSPDPLTTAQQAMVMLDKAEWPVAKRWFPNGTTGIKRGNHYVEGSTLDILQLLRFTELGALFAMRDGRLGWWDRAKAAALPAPSATICGGAAGVGVSLTEMWRAKGLGRIRNRVVVAGGYGEYGDPTIPPDEQRSVDTSAVELHMYIDPPPAPLPQDIWAQAILDVLDDAPPQTMLGTILPHDDEVELICCAEFGDSWTVTSPTGDKVVRLVGQHVSLTPGLVEVDAVTEDVTAIFPVKHATVGAGSSNLRSYADNYAAARSGALPATVEVMTGVNQYWLGQNFFAGPQYEVWETFLWFDTSSIPVGATILKAWFGALVWPAAGWVVGTPYLEQVIEVRSYNTGGWRPTVTTADWRPGANIASTSTVRARWDTANGINFQTFEDVNMAAAIVKGGETQLFVVTKRTVDGTPPPSTTSPSEFVELQWPRLRVTYRLP